MQTTLNETIDETTKIEDLMHILRRVSTAKFIKALEANGWTYENRALTYKSLYRTIDLDSPPHQIKKKVLKTLIHLHGLKLHCAINHIMQM